MFLFLFLSLRLSRRLCKLHHLTGALIGVVSLAVAYVACSNITGETRAQPLGMSPGIAPKAPHHSFSATFASKGAE